MDYDLTDDYIAEARQRAYRFQGQWCGTSGSLAADVARLLTERKKMQVLLTELEQSNAELRAAVEARIAASDACGGEYADAMRNTMGCCNGGKLPTNTTDDAPAVWRDISTASAEKYAADRAEPEIPVDWILQGQREMDAAPDDIRWTGDSILAKQSDDIRPGTTAKFGTGAVRSSDVEEFRYDLISPIGLREVARACAEGAAKYGDWNWEKGMPVNDLLNHVLAHVYKFLGGDRSEPHLGHAAWGMIAAIHSHELWPELNAKTLRQDGCKAPTDPV
jgi:hypothetical protein